MNRKAIKERVAEELLRIEAVFLRPDDPFTWASGIQSPIYCDNRLTLSDPAARELIEQSLAATVREYYPDCEILMGTSTAGIAHAAITAHLLDLPMGYVRGSAKDHGRGNQIEGRLLPGQKTVIVEDLISTAGSVADTAKVLREAGADVLGVVSIFTYGMTKGVLRLEQEKLKNVSLSDLDTLVPIAAAKGYIQDSDILRLLAFRDHPEDGSWKDL